MLNALLTITFHHVDAHPAIQETHQGHAKSFRSKWNQTVAWMRIARRNLPVSVENARILVMKLSHAEPTPFVPLLIPYLFELWFVLASKDMLVMLKRNVNWVRMNQFSKKFLLNNFISFKTKAFHFTFTSGNFIVNLLYS